MARANSSLPGPLAAGSNRLSDGRSGRATLAFPFVTILSVSRRPVKELAVISGMHFPNPANGQ